MKDYFMERVAAFKLTSALFLELGNTGAAVQLMMFAYHTAVSAPLHVDRTRSVYGLIKPDDVRYMIKFRHPDPRLLPTLHLRDSELQVRGSWQKIKLGQRRRIPSRMGFVAFCYKGNTFASSIPAD